jgi:hypothetical protein
MTTQQHAKKPSWETGLRQQSIVGANLKGSASAEILQTRVPMMILESKKLGQTMGANAIGKVQALSDIDVGFASQS